MVFVIIFLDRLALTYTSYVTHDQKSDAIMLKRASSSQIVTVCVSRTFFFQAAEISPTAWKHGVERVLGIIRGKS
jgi:hypothetical protein